MTHLALLENMREIKVITVECFTYMGVHGQ